MHALIFGKTIVTAQIFDAAFHPVRFEFCMFYTYGLIEFADLEGEVTIRH